MYDILIFQSPYTFTNEPSLAPALLKACVEKDNLSAYAWDYSGEFNYLYKNHEFFEKICVWLQAPETKLTVDEFNWYNSIITNCVTKIIEKNVRWVAISLLSYNSQRFTEDMCFQLKLRAPHIKIVCGGGGTTLKLYQFNKKWHDLMLESKLVDAVLIGEGEYALSRIIKNDLTGLVIEPLLSNDKFENIPFPNYDDYDLTIYDSVGSYEERFEEHSKLIFNITASKGCVKDCNFCDVAKIWSKFRYRSGTKVADEIIYLHNNYGVKTFNFTDSLINGGLKPFYEMNMVLAEKLPKQIKYYGQFIFRGSHDMPEKYFESMSLAGCDIVNMGLESGSEQVRNHMRKGSTDEDVEYSSNMLLKYNIKQIWNIMVGYPTETEDDWKKTMDLVKYWVPRSNGLIKISPIGTFLMLDGVPIMDREYQEELQIKRNILGGYDAFGWENHNSNFEIRANRFYELCDLLIELDPKNKHVLERKKVRVNNHLRVFNENRV